MSAQISGVSALPKRGPGRPKGSKNRPKMPPAGPPRDAATMQTPQYRESFNDVRARNEIWKAKHNEVAYRRLIGELVERSAYDKALADAMSPIIALLESLPTRIVAQVSEADARRVQHAVEQEVRAIRLAIMNELRSMVVEESSDAV